MNAFLAIVRRDLLLAARRKSEVFTALFEAGYRTRAVDRDGHYVFTREA